MKTIGEKLLTGKISSKLESPGYCRAMVFKAYEFSRFLTKINVANWLCTGSVLGFVRNRKVIPGDFDIDLAIWHDDVKKIHELPDKVKEKFKIFPWYLDKSLNWYHEEKIAVDNGNLPIDICEYVAQGNITYPVADPRMTCEKRFFTDLRKIKFYGCDFYIPRDSEAYLNAVYGPDWKKTITRREYVGKFFVGKFWHTHHGL